MKNSGLKNRFPEEVRTEWIFWYDCMRCGKNKWDALHHIISSSVTGYVAGDHNSSILNSCPIHNFGCHIGNEAWLGRNVGMLLRKTLSALTLMGYELKPIDREFIRVYNKFYV